LAVVAAQKIVGLQLPTPPNKSPAIKTSLFQQGLLSANHTDEVIGISMIFLLFMYHGNIVCRFL
jgi:hypothetical protein